MAALPTSRKRTLLTTICLCCTIVRCSADSPEGIPDPHLLELGGATEIVDGSTTGNENFFFLPPLAADPGDAPGTFDPNLPVVVEICVPETGGCDSFAEPLDRFTTMGDGAERVRAEDDHYVVVWKPGTGTLAGDYRIRVLVGGLEFGHADIRLRDDIHGNRTFNLKQSVPVKFRIGENAVRLAFVGVSGSGPLTYLVSGFGVVPIEKGSAAIAIPEGDRPSFVIAVNADQDPVLTGFVDSSEPFVLTPETTLTSVATLVLRLLFVIVPEDDLGGLVHSDEDFPAILSDFEDATESGPSPFDSRVVLAEIGGLVGRVGARLETLDQLVTRGGLTAAADQTREIAGTPITARDTNGTETEINLLNESFIYWDATNSGVDGLEIGSALIPKREFCTFCIPPLIGQLFPSVDIAGIEGTNELRLKQDYGRNGLLLGSSIIGLIFTAAGIPLPSGFEKDLYSCATSVLDIHLIGTVFESDGVSAALDEIFTQVLHHPSSLAINCGEILFNGLFDEETTGLSRYIKIVGKIMKKTVEYVDLATEIVNRGGVFVDLLRYSGAGPSTLTLCQYQGEFTVCPRPLAELRLDPTEARLVLGEAPLLFTAATLDDAGDFVRGEAVTWTYTGTGLLNIEDVPLDEHVTPGTHQVLVTGVVPGEGELEAQSGEFSASAAIIISRATCGTSSEFPRIDLQAPRWPMSGDVVATVVSETGIVPNTTLEWTTTNSEINERNGLPRTTHAEPGGLHLLLLTPLRSPEGFLYFPAMQVFVKWVGAPGGEEVSGCFNAETTVEPPPDPSPDPMPPPDPGSSDIDGDGVPNLEDFCPGTSTGASIDRLGCSLVAGFDLCESEACAYDLVAGQARALPVRAWNSLGELVEPLAIPDGMSQSDFDRAVSEYYQTERIEFRVVDQTGGGAVLAGDSDGAPVLQAIGDGETEIVVSLRSLDFTETFHVQVQVDDALVGLYAGELSLSDGSNLSTTMIARGGASSEYSIGGITLTFGDAILVSGFGSITGCVTDSPRLVSEPTAPDPIYSSNVLYCYGSAGAISTIQVGSDGNPHAGSWSGEQLEAPFLDPAHSDLYGQVLSFTVSRKCAKVSEISSETVTSCF